MIYTGTWHILEMEMWDEDYFNMEVQAFIHIGPNRMGNFQFGLVPGALDGEVLPTSGGSVLSSPGRVKTKNTQSLAVVG